MLTLHWYRYLLSGRLYNKHVHTTKGCVHKHVNKPGEKQISRFNSYKIHVFIKFMMCTSEIVLFSFTAEKYEFVGLTNSRSVT